MKLYRGRVFTPTGDPFAAGAAETHVYRDDGFVAVEGSVITAVGDWSSAPKGDHQVFDYGRDALLTPGFIDTHLHAPQLEMIGSPGPTGQAPSDSRG